MSTELTTSEHKLPEQSLKLIPSGIDLTTFKTQLVVAAAVCLLAALALYCHVFKSGFRPDDLVVISRLASGLQSGWSNIPAALTTPDFSARGIGPLPAASLLVDYCLWHHHASMYHVVNFALFMGSAILVTQIAAAIGGLRGNRLGGAPAVWAGLLFCTYPLHGETVVMLSDRGYLLGGLFYLATVLFYIKFRTWKERSYFSLALGSCFLGLLCSTFDWTIPLTISMTEFLLIPLPTKLEAGRQSNLNSQRFMSVLLFWFVLFFTTSIGMVAPALVPLRSTPIDLSLAVKTVATLEGMKQILLPMTDHHLIQYSSGIAYCLLLATLGARLVLRDGGVRILVFLVLWFVAGFAGMSPSLAGPHLVTDLSHAVRNNIAAISFIASGPLCIGLALCSLPGAGIVPRKYVAVLSAISSCALTILTAAWFLASQVMVQALYNP